MPVQWAKQQMSVMHYCFPTIKTNFILHVTGGEGTQTQESGCEVFGPMHITD